MADKGRCVQERTFCKDCLLEEKGGAGFDPRCAKCKNSMYGCQNKQFWPLHTGMEKITRECSEKLIKETQVFCVDCKPLLEEFLYELSLLNPDITRFKYFFDRPTTTPLSNEKSSQVRQINTVKEIITFSIEHFQWYRFKNLQNILKLHVTLEVKDLTQILNRLERRIHSYLSAGRIDQYGPKAAVFKVDPEYSQFPVTDWLLVDECTKDYLKQTNSSRKDISLCFWIITDKSLNTDAYHCIEETGHNEGPSEIVHHGHKYTLSWDYVGESIPNHSSGMEPPASLMSHSPKLFVAQCNYY